MVNERFYNESIGVTASIDPEGQVKPLSLIWQGQQHTIVDVGRQWTTEEGRHVLVMTADGSRFELQLSRQSLAWYLRRAWQTEIMV
jgi:hypothetical protein